LLLFSIGCFCFTLPHILSEAYIPNKKEGCDIECTGKQLHRSKNIIYFTLLRINGARELSFSFLILVRYLFNFAYILLGAGNVPMYTLTVSYIHENNIFGKISTNHHYAWYHMHTAFGPAIGMLVGGQVSRIWVDWFDKVFFEGGCGCKMLEIGEPYFRIK
jgi:hypothetical protein